MPNGPELALIPVENSVTVPLGVIRPIRSPVFSANHKLPSGPDVMPNGLQLALIPAENCVTEPLGVTLTIIGWEAAVLPADHRLPSGPNAIPAGSKPAAKLVALPAGVMRPIAELDPIVYHMLPSGPEVMSCGPLPPAENSDTAGDTVSVAAALIPAIAILGVGVNFVPYVDPPG